MVDRIQGWMRHMNLCVPRDRFEIVSSSPAFMKRGSPGTCTAAGVPGGRAAIRDDARAERVYLGEGVHLAADVVDDDSLAALEVGLLPAEPPRAVAAVLRVDALEQLLE